MSFHEKYLKYKNKYISLKNMKGGAPNDELKQIRGALDTISSEIDSINIVLAKLINVPSTPNPPLNDKWRIFVDRITQLSNGQISEDTAVELINAKIKDLTPTIDSLILEDIDKIRNAHIRSLHS
jgi:hypothetical protein